jgi:predicted ribosome quality control (RQC) complex YloA/Tae2 family protein
MDLQKPTVLDAARLANELKRFRNGAIAQARMSQTRLELYFEISRPETVIRFTIEKKYAAIAEIDEIESSDLKTIQAFAGYEIVDSSQVAGDRVVALELKKEDRLGRIRQARLILELIPNKGNCVLLDEKGDIRWSMRKIEKYSPPPTLKMATILNINMENINPEMQEPADLNKIFGISKRDAINIQIEKYQSLDETVIQLRKYANKAASAGPAWLIYKSEILQGYSLVQPVLENGEHPEKCDSALRLYAKYYDLALIQSSESDRIEELTSRLAKEIARARGKLQSLTKELEAAEEAAIFRKYGDMILANLDKIRKGNKSFLIEYGDGDSSKLIEIELDPSRSGSENAEEYFKKYKKAQSSLNMINRRITGAKDEIEKLQSVKSETNDDIDSLEMALEKLGLLPKKAHPGKKIVQARRLPYKIFRASNGWEILVGRTNSENDELSLKIARKDDYWFHAWQAAGSHVVLRPPNKTAVPEKHILLEAASLAAYFSKARTSSKVPVAYTFAKFVRKPKGFPPGQVLVEKEKQLMVKPADPDDFLPSGESGNPD